MTFQDDLNRMFAEGGIYEHGVTDYLEREHPALFETPTITVHKHSAYVMVTPEVLLDAGAMTEEEALAAGWRPEPPTPWSRRLRWRWQAWRERTGRKIGGWIAGEDLSERDEDW